MATSGEWTSNTLNMNPNLHAQGMVVHEGTAILEYVTKYLAIAESTELISSNASWMNFCRFRF